MEIDQYNLRTGTADAVARLMSFAQITCKIIMHGTSKDYQRWTCVDLVCLKSFSFFFSLSSIISQFRFRRLQRYYAKNLTCT